MIEIVVILFLLVYIGFKEYLTQQERKKLIDAYLAKNITELKQAEAIEKMPQAKEPVSELPPDFIPMDEATDDEFMEAIRGETGQEDSNFKKLVKRIKHG